MESWQCNAWRLEGRGGPDGPIKCGDRASSAGDQQEQVFRFSRRYSRLRRNKGRTRPARMEEDSGEMTPKPEVGRSQSALPGGGVDPDLLPANPQKGIGAAHNNPWLCLAVLGSGCHSGTDTGSDLFLEGI
jgi:hypothetical protein